MILPSIGVMRRVSLGDGKGILICPSRIRKLARIGLKLDSSVSVVYSGLADGFNLIIYLWIFSPFLPKAYSGNESCKKEDAHFGL